MYRAMTAEKTANIAPTVLRRAAGTEARMSGSVQTDAMDDRRPPEIAKTRRCLRCKTPFQSKWSGERICGRCKGSAAWRNGVPLGVRPSGAGG